MDDLIDVCVKNMVNDNFTEAQAREYMKKLLPQLECEFGGDRCFGILADMDFIMVSTYEADGADPELVIYKKR